MLIGEHTSKQLRRRPAWVATALLAPWLLASCADAVPPPLQDYAPPPGAYGQDAHGRGGYGQGAYGQGAYGQDAAPAPSAAVPAGYRLVFDDEFNSTAGIGNGHGQTPPPTPWWNMRHAILQPGETYVSATDRRAYSTSSGVLTMTTYRTAQGKMTEADIETVKSFGPEFYAEIRMKGPQVNGAHDGVWFLSVDNGRPDASGGHTEFDLVEQYGPNDQGDHTSQHVWPGARTDMTHRWKSYYTVRPEGKAMDWHTYGLHATRDAFIVYRDGQVIQTIPRTPFQYKPMYLLLSLFGNGPHAPPATMQVDYARVYAPG